MFENGRRRLTSWKEIAAYVGRDVRTVLRWEKDRGLPVHRPPGATGRVVFAYTDELDAWLHSGVEEEAPIDAPTSVETVPPPIPVAPSPADRVRSSRWPAAAAMILVGIAAFGTWQVLARNSTPPPLTIEMTDSAILAVGPDRAVRWRHHLPAGEVVIRVENHLRTFGERLHDGDIAVATAYSTRGGDGQARGGELFRFSPDGRVKGTFTFDDRILFGAGPYSAPWGITDYRVDPSGSRIAVAAHHFEWWPSVVTVLDDTWKRGGTFVNAGWVERLHWLSDDRLLIAGFSNDLDGGMIALLDVNALNGQSPATQGSRFACVSCGPSAPIRYIVLPRSEVNLVTASPFNRVVLSLKPDAIVARTIEKPANANAPDALYEFTPALDFVRASYSDRYWEVHAELEAAGKIDHSRERCPDRDGPREIRVWEPETGWTPVATAPSRAPSSQARSRR
jgi:hypothetical protein